MNLNVAIRLDLSKSSFTQSVRRMLWFGSETTVLYSRQHDKTGVEY
jgi:hypothetical protein